MRTSRLIVLRPTPAELRNSPTASSSRDIVHDLPADLNATILLLPHLLLGKSRQEQKDTTHGFVLYDSIAAVRSRTPATSAQMALAMETGLRDETRPPICGHARLAQYDRGDLAHLSPTIRSDPEA